MLNSIIDTTAGITASSLIICTVASIVLGVAAACLYMFKNTYNKRFVTTIALLPVMVQLVIMLVNGNLGAAVAVGGAFSLVRFRSVAGSAKDICAIFLAMVLGLATGMGYVVVAVIFLVVIGVAMFALEALHFGEMKQGQNELKITIPEDLDYSGLFDDLMDKYTTQSELTRVRLTNMGALYELSYIITLKDAAQQKAFIDEIRTRNGNLNISLGRVSQKNDEL